MRGITVSANIKSFSVRRVRRCPEEEKSNVLEGEKTGEFAYFSRSSLQMSLSYTGKTLS